MEENKEFKKSQRKKREAQVELWRGYTIDRLIASGAYPNVPFLMKKFEVSEATILRDIERLKSDFKAPIAYDRFKKGYFYTHPTFRIPANLSTEKQIVAARLMANLLETLHGTPIYSQAIEVFTTLSTDIDDDSETGLAKRLSNRIAFLGISPVPISDEVWSALEDALAKNHYITFDYAYYDGGQPSQITVEPWQLLFSGGMWTLYAKETATKKIKFYNVWLISNVRAHEETFTLPENFEYTKRAKGNFGRYIGDESYEFKIQIESPITLNWVRTYKWAEDQTFASQADGSTIMTFTSNQYYPVLNWVMSQGQWMTPLAPERLVNDWRDHVQAMAGKLKVEK